MTQNEFAGGERVSGSSRLSQLSPLYGASGSYGNDEDGYAATMKRYGPASSAAGANAASSRFASLEDRGRSDWRRVSVPERGKDFKSLPRKYNR